MKTFLKILTVLFCSFLTLILLVGFWSGAFVWGPITLVNRATTSQLLLRSRVKIKNKDQTRTYSKSFCTPETPPEECPCLALIHGIGDNSLTWSYFLSQSPKLWDVPLKLVSIDLPGSGGTDRLQNLAEYRISNLALWYTEKLNKECKPEQPLILVGNSFGGWISMWITKLYPERVKANILLNPAGLDYDYSQVVWLFLDPDFALMSEQYVLSRPKGLSEWTRFFIRDAIRAVRKTEAENYVKAQIAYGDYVDSFLKDIAPNTYVYWGLDDRVLPNEHYLSYKNTLPEGNAQSIEKCSHITHKQCPDPVLDAIVDHVRLVYADASGLNKTHEDAENTENSNAENQKKEITTKKTRNSKKQRDKKPTSL